jgi:transcriptional regulator with XRE-family HTH domain
MKKRGGKIRPARNPEIESRSQLLGTALRALRHQRQRKQVGLSAETGVTKGMLSSYETGRQLPSLKTLVAVLMGLEYDFHDLQDAMDYLAGKPPRLRPGGEEKPEAEAEREVGGAVITLVRHLGLRLPLGPPPIELPPARVRRSGRAR